MLLEMLHHQCHSQKSSVIVSLCRLQTFVKEESTVLQSLPIQKRNLMSACLD